MLIKIFSFKGALIRADRVYERDAYLIFLDFKAIQAMTKSKRGLKVTPQKLVLVKMSNKRSFLEVGEVGELFSNFPYILSAYSRGLLFEGVLI